jgi:2-dehydro-3-deoxy-D-gluconate 5-dehydrogenase
MFSLKDRVALVTGAGNGIGRAIALEFARAGADVAVAGRNPDTLREVALAITEAGRSSLEYPVDVRHLSAVKAMVGQVVSRFGKIDVLVNNAGIINRAPSMEETEEAWDLIMDTNVKGLFFCSQAAASHMIPRCRGTIINLASVFGILGRPERAAYSASKAAVAQITRTLAVEWAPHNVRVNAVAPGATRTPTREVTLGDPVLLQGLVAQYPLGRIADPGDIVGAALFLASDASAFVTGQTIVVDGGHTIQ